MPGVATLRTMRYRIVLAFGRGRRPGPARLRASRGLRRSYDPLARLTDVTAVMALAGGATLCQAGYLGSLASSLAIAAMGNRPVSREALWRCAAGRAELGRMATPADDSRTNHLRLAAG